MLTVGSLFSGIGGFDLGLERTGGFKTVWQCEIDPFCLKVLEKHWPDVKRFTDIHEMKEDIPYVDVICGGFPCQPVSCAGKRKGKEDKRWLWPEFYRIVCEVKPRWVLVENVPGLLSADSGRLFAGILRDLASSGYDAEWNIVSAASVGAPHLRKRVFVVAHPTSQQNDSQHIEPGRFGEQFGRALEGGREALRQENGQAGYNMLGGCCEDVAHALGLDPQRRGEAGNVACQSREAEGAAQERQRGRDASVDSRAAMADANCVPGEPSCGHLEGRGSVVEAVEGEQEPGCSCAAPREVPNSNQIGRDGRAGVLGQGGRQESEDGGAESANTDIKGLAERNGGDSERGSCPHVTGGDWGPAFGHMGLFVDGLSEGLADAWRPGWEDGTSRLAIGQKDRVNRLKALGNAIVPQCAEFVGRCILEAEARQ